MMEKRQFLSNFSPPPPSGSEGRGGERRRGREGEQTHFRLFFFMFALRLFSSRFLEDGGEEEEKCPAHTFRVSPIKTNEVERWRRGMGEEENLGGTKKFFSAPDPPPLPASLS